MKIGELARLLGVDRTTIHNWTKEKALERFLSPSARGDETTHRIFTAQDADVLNTVRHLKAENRTIGWDDIARVLDNGTRMTNYPKTSMSMDTAVVSVPQAQQAAEVLVLKSQLENKVQEVEKLESQLQSERERNDELMKRIGDLQREIGRLEGRLESQNSKND